MESPLKHTEEPLVGILLCYQARHCAWHFFCKYLQNCSRYFESSKSSEFFEFFFIILMLRSPQTQIFLNVQNAKNIIKQFIFKIFVMEFQISHFEESLKVWANLDRKKVLVTNALNIKAKKECLLLILQSWKDQLH